MLAYHDREWGVPHHDDRSLFELLTLEGAQAAHPAHHRHAAGSIVAPIMASISSVSPECATRRWKSC